MFLNAFNAYPEENLFSPTSTPKIDKIDEKGVPGTESNSLSTFLMAD